MRKKKHKKKNKNMKKREIQKMQVENQQEVLGADVDKNQVENQQEILVDAAEKEQRRTTRLGAIIAIVAQQEQFQQLHTDKRPKSHSIFDSPLHKLQIME